MANFFREVETSPEEILKELKSACQDLVYISEIDSEVTPFRGPMAEEVSPELISEFFAARMDEGVEQLTLEAFFERLTAEKDWHAERNKQAVAGYKKLYQIIKENLTHATVLKFGRVQKQIFVVGIDAEGYLAGVTAKAVET